MTARGLDKLMERFIYVKELMHMFDDPSKATDTGAKFEAQLAEFDGTGTPNDWSIQTHAEIACFWMALGSLCPEAIRKQLEAERVAEKIDDQEISMRLRIPLVYVPRLFEQRYGIFIERLVNGKGSR